jgi:hypothetical protein
MVKLRSITTFQTVLDLNSIFSNYVLRGEKVPHTTI